MTEADFRAAVRAGARVRIDPAILADDEDGEEAIFDVGEACLLADGRPGVVLDTGARYPVDLDDVGSVE